MNVVSTSHSSVRNICPGVRGVVQAADLVGMTWAVASAIGPVLGGVFTGMADWGWRFCFIINVPVGFCAIIGLLLFLNLESPKVTLAAGLKRVDWLGTYFL